MKAREVRLGNLVIDGHDMEKVNARMIAMLAGNHADFDPIPINKELLTQLGFENVFDENYQAGKIVVELNEKCTYVYVVCPMPWIELEHIKYVHQLQNLYFALTGEELTLKP